MPNENENVYVAAPPERLPSPHRTAPPSLLQSQSHHNDALNPLAVGDAETAAVLNQVVRRQQGICQRLRLRLRW